MKIGLVRRGYSESGGAERYLLRFAEGLTRAGHEPILFASPEWPTAAWHHELVRIEGNGPRTFADSFASARLRERCDVVLSLDRVWDCDAYRAGDGVHRAWLERRKKFEPWWKSWGREKRTKHQETLELEQAIFGSARLIIANSRMVADEIKRYFDVPAERVRIIHNGLPEEAFNLDPSSFQPVHRRATRERFGLQNGERAVLFAGTGWERKGLRFAMQAIKKAKNAKLLVAGAGSRRGLPVSAKTQFLGEVSAMGDLMEAADLFLLPTIYDPFSNACLEAMAAGLPIITTRANGFTEIMRTELDGEILENPADIDGIAAAIEKWSHRETPESRDGRRMEAVSHSIEENVRKTVNALRTVMRTG